MNDQNNENFGDLEKAIKKALSREKQTGLNASQLNSLHLMISKGEHASAKVRPRFLNWLIPSSILATAMIAFMVFDRFPSSETLSTETSAQWENSPSGKVASKSQEPEQKKILAVKKDVAPPITPAAAPAQIVVERKAEKNESERNRAGPKLAKPTPAKPSKEKSWESNSAPAQKKSTSLGLGGTTSGAGSASFGSAADSAKVEEQPGSGAASKLATSLKKSDAKGKAMTAAVSIVTMSDVSPDISNRIKMNVSSLAVCNLVASTWNLSFKVSKSGKIEVTKIGSENGGTDLQAKCLTKEIKSWNIGSSPVSPVDLKIKFSGQSN